MTPASSQPETRLPIAVIVMLTAGVVGGLQVGKVAPAVPILQEALGISLVQAGFLISLNQMAGVIAGLAIGLAVGGWGLRRSVVTGLSLMALSSALGSLSQHAGLLLFMRAVEGLGFLLAVMPGPSLLRMSVSGPRTSLVLGLWSCYMPLGQGLAILGGPWVIALMGWQGWWLALAGVTALVARLAWRKLPPDTAHTSGKGNGSPEDGWRHRLAITLRAPGPWLISVSFGMYAGQWLAVVGFLPSIYGATGITAGMAGAMTALVSVSNIAGNIAGGRLLTRGVRPQILLWSGFAAMGVAAMFAFANLPALTAMHRYLAIVLFSAVGGLIPSTLFTLAVRLSPNDRTVSTTVGWMQQWISLGQLTIAPLVGAMATMTGNWHWTWVVTGACSFVGILLGIGIWRELARKRARSVNH